jgi:hypothetical protein
MAQLVDEDRHDIDPVRRGVGIINPGLSYVVALFGVVDAARQRTPRQYT